MTNPPPPGNWGPPNPGPQPPYGQWPPQHPFGQPPAPPQSNGVKWMLAGIGVLLVIAITIGATLLFTRDSGDDTTSPADGKPAAGEIASANDTGPVLIITEDPTCDPWRPIIRTLASQQRQGWDRRDYSAPEAEWTTEQRQAHQAVASAMRVAAEQTVGLIDLTPHRLMRELYEQSVAYWRAYADSVPTYSEVDNSLAVAASDATDSITSICATIENGTAKARGPLVSPSEKLQNLPNQAGSVSPDVFMTEADAEFCNTWSVLVKDFEGKTTEWREWDAVSPASEWTANHRRVMDAVGPIMKEFADDIEAKTADYDNSTLRDVAAMSSLYFRAYVRAIPSYSAPDSYLSSIGTLGYLLIYNACEATGS